MNDGPLPPALDDPPLPSSSVSVSSSASPSSTSDQSSVEYAGNGNDGDEDAASRVVDSSSDDSIESRVAAKCHVKLLELLNTYDSLVYMELAALYYLDTSTILIILRTLVHLTQISHSRTLALARASRLNLKLAKTNIFLVLSINLVALFIHAFIAPAEASEATRGYLHGHLIVDIIGQRAANGWLGRVRLCVMDCLVGLLQIIAVGVVGEVSRVESMVERIKHGDSPARVQRSSVGEVPAESQSRSSRVVEGGLSMFGFRTRRGQSETASDQGAGIELQDLGPASGGSIPSRPSDTGAAQRLEPERARDSSDESLTDLGQIDTASQVLEALSSGQVIVIRLRLFDLLQDHFWEWRNRRLAGTVELGLG